MSHRNSPLHRSVARGFTLVEVLITMALVTIIAMAAFTFFNTSINQYISLQVESSSFSDLAMQSQRLANVLRGVTDINSASADEFDSYAYFAPADQYVSRIRYYKSADGKKLLADVTRMTSNPPQGTPIPATLQTYTIMPNFYQPAGTSTFTYLDAAGNTLALPISDLRTIKSIKVSLSTRGGNLSDTSRQTINLQLSLRNRKTNL